jgi:hypothetical protein
VESLWEKHKPIAASKGEKGIRAKTTFVSQLLMTLDEKLKKAELERQRYASQSSGESIKASKSLLPIDFLKSDTNFNNYISYNYPNLTYTTTRKSTSYSPYSSLAGKMAGEELEIHRPIDGKHSNNGAINGYLTQD